MGIQWRDAGWPGGGTEGGYGGGVARVATMLTPDERLRVDAVANGVIHAVHRDCVDDLRRDLRSQRVRALIVSTSMCHGVQMTGVARMVREFPRVPTVALLSEFDRATVRTVLSLGQCGIRTLIDVREPNGWRELRAVLLNERTSDVQRLAMSRLALDLAQAPAGTRRFFDSLFAHASRTPTIRQFARSLQIIPGTLMSRFYRAHLPPPKRYLAFARLTCAARLFENPGVSVSSVSDQLCYSSPQSFSRHVRSILGMSAIQFRVRYDCEGMLDSFREELVLRHLAVWRAFDPFGHTARSIGIRKSENRRRFVSFPEPDPILRSVAEELGGGEQRKDLGCPGE